MLWWALYFRRYWLAAMSIDGYTDPLREITSRARKLTDDERVLRHRAESVRRAPRTSHPPRRLAVEPGMRCGGRPVRMARIGCAARGTDTL